MDSEGIILSKVAQTQTEKKLRKKFNRHVVSVCLTGSYLAHSGLKLLIFLKRYHDLQLNLSKGKQFQRFSPLSLRWGGWQHAGRQGTGDVAEGCILICKQREPRSGVDL